MDGGEGADVGVERAEHFVGLFAAFDGETGVGPSDE